MPKTLTLLGLFAVLCSSLNGCSALDRYERTYAARYDANTQTGEVSVSLRPITPVYGTPAPPAALSNETIEKIVKLIMAGREVSPSVVAPIDFKQPVEAMK